MARVDAFDRKVDVDLARKKEAEVLKASRKAREPDREELDRQLREIARFKARYPDGRIEPIEEVRQSEITGRVLGYTEGKKKLFSKGSAEDWCGSTCGAGSCCRSARRSTTTHTAGTSVSTGEGMSDDGRFAG